MLLEIFLAFLLGILAGTFTGLSPGIHINLIASILLASLSSLTSIPVIALVVFIVAMSITHSFIDFIPSIFLGAPEEDTFLSILPGHEMLKQGLGFQAVILTLKGSLFSIIPIIIFTPIFIFFLPSLYSTLKIFIPFLLIFISLYSIFREEKIFLSFLVFILSGFLGFVSFNLPIEEPLLPLLTGFFGLSSLFMSLKDKTSIKKQEISSISEIKLEKSELKKTILSSFISAPLCSFLPGISSSHSAFISSELIPQSKKSFLFLIGSINTIIMALSFVTLYSISRARSGSAVAIQEILKDFSFQYLLIILLTIIISSFIAFFIGVKIAKIFSLSINKINYRKITIVVIFLLFIINIIFSSWLGLLVLITSLCIGLFCILSSAKRINMMGSLIIPVILYYLSF